MQQGEIVLGERYFYSCLANLRARGSAEDQWIYEVAAAVIQPDVAFFFDVPVETAVSRVQRRAEEKDRYIGMNLQCKLREEYLEICKANHGVMISTELPVDECYGMVKSQVERVMKYECNQKGD